MLALVAPTAVLAQSAGDEQYVDPFQGQGDGGGGNNGSQSGDDSAPAAQTTPTDDTAGATAESTDTATLPRTGLPLLPVALTGLFLLSAGFVGRRVTVPPVAAAPSGVALAPVPRVVTARAEAAPLPRAGLPVIGLGLVGLFILSLLRRRA